MTDKKRTLEFETEVVGTPEVVWQAIATGPGISSWYVPHTVEEREGGTATARFGPGDGMVVPGRVAVWEPHQRVVFDGGDPEVGLAFEWTIEAKDGGTCVVRLVNSGFGSGEEWDAQYDGMAEGWKMFLLNLQLHLKHFPGRTATPALPMSVTPGTAAGLWSTLTEALGVPAAPEVGASLTLRATPELMLSGTVVETTPLRISLLLDAPAPGLAFVAIEPMGPAFAVSVWSYLYGDEGAAIAPREEGRWRAWLGERFAPPSS